MSDAAVVSELKADDNAQSTSHLDRYVLHFAPDSRRFLKILVISFCLAAFVYGIMLRVTYSSIDDAIRSANVVEDTLRTIPNFPIGPRRAKSGLELAGNKLDQAAAFEVLKAWGVYGRSIQLSQLLKGEKSVVEEKSILDAMIDCNQPVAGKGTFPLKLIRCLLSKFGGGKETGLQQNCLWREVERVLVGYSSSGADFEKKTAERVTAGEGSVTCDKHNDKITFRYIFDWFGESRDDAAALRDLLLTTRLLAFPVQMKDAPDAAGHKVPSWWLINPIRIRLLAEILSRVQSNEEVRAARSWLVLWRGPEQFLLLFTGVGLLLLMVDRTLARYKLRWEADRVLSELDKRFEEIQSEHREVIARSKAAKDLASALEARAADGVMSAFIPLKLPSAAQTIPLVEQSNATPAQPHGSELAIGSVIAVISNEIRQLIRALKSVLSRAARLLNNHRNGAGVRADSVVLYMAEKAVRRIVIRPRSPELFRQTCDAINAEVERSGWVLRYAARALPAIGFIGTVRGIMVALPAAQNLFGTSGTAQIAALNGVIEPLGLAFATTLIALVAGLITGLYGDWEVAQEQVLLSRIEEALIDRIDPAEE